MAGVNEFEPLLQMVHSIASGSLEEAHAMPPGMYLSPQILDLEIEHVFSKDWICIGRTADIPELGDYLTYKIGH